MKALPGITAALTALSLLSCGNPDRGGAAGLPRLLDLGSKTCIPCKLMTPILDSLRKEFDGTLAVDFVEVGMGGDKALAHKYGISVIPTQIFLDAKGTELWRHEGYLTRYAILDKWKELGYDFAARALEPTFSRSEPVRPDDRPASRICHMCDEDIADSTVVIIKTAKGDVRLCGLHCYFIMYSCLLEDKTGFEKNALATDARSGAQSPATAMTFLYGHDESGGRPWIRAFISRADALAARRERGGSIVSWSTLRDKELHTRCGFCDRAVYPQDAALVKIDGLHSWGCCSHCALGVAARTGKDIEVYQPDRLTGEMVTVKTLDGHIESLDPPTAVAWFGLRKNSEGKLVSAGCFHQGFFSRAENLMSWIEKNPASVGKMISIDEALGDKMKLTTTQIL